MKQYVIPPIFAYDQIGVVVVHLISVNMMNWMAGWNEMANGFLREQDMLHDIAILIGSWMTTQKHNGTT